MVAMAKAFAKAKSKGRADLCISAGVKVKTAITERCRVVKKADGKGKTDSATRQLRPDRKARAQAKTEPAASVKAAAKTGKAKATATGSTIGKAKVPATALRNRLTGKARPGVVCGVKAKRRVRPAIRRDALTFMVHDMMCDLLGAGPGPQVRAQAALMPRVSDESDSEDSNPEADSPDSRLHSLTDFWTELGWVQMTFPQLCDVFRLVG